MLILSSKILVIIVAIIHLYILWLEMFAWLTVGKKTFKTIPSEMFEPTKKMAANQGLYNGFLAAGLIWSLFISNSIWENNIRVFFLSCVLIAGLYGSITVSKRIFLVQALPAIIALLVTGITYYS
ncbi:DUF1304 domain-containing protein [Zhouia sp. PK063]|uniref:DUF1304 domain-containing protein n=1 Tax=Zhouia sp. PK063 TaxID=3373602 RepID=UPI0037AAF995